MIALPAQAAPETEPSTEPAQATEPEPEPTMPSQVIVVTGTRTPRRVADDPIGTEVIGARELSARNVRDASRALEAEPGVQVERSFRGHSVQLRGFDSKYVRVLVDGQPVVGQVNDVIDLRRFGLDAIERIELVRGAASALYGSDALAGVVNLISRRPRRPFEASGFVQYGQLNQSLAGMTVGGRQGTLGGSLTLNWFGNNSWDLNPEDPATNGDARRVGLGTARLFWRPTPEWEVLASVRAGHLDSRGADLQPPRAIYNRRVGETDLALNAQAHWTPDDDTRLALYAQSNAFLRSFSRLQRQGPGGEKQQSIETLTRLESQLDRRVLPALSLTGGLGGQYAHFESPRLDPSSVYVPSGWAYAQAEAQLGEHIDLVAGGRLDVVADASLHVQPSPRAALRFDLAPLVPGLSVRVSYGDGFRTASFGERFLLFSNQVQGYVVNGNPNLLPEHSRGGQAGIEWTAPEGMLPAGLVPSVRVTGYYTHLNGLIQASETAESTPFAPMYEYVNYEAARMSGIESALRVVAGSWLIADVGYTWQDTFATLLQVDATGRTVPESGPLPGRARRQITASLIVQSREHGFEASLRNQWLLLRSPMQGGLSLPDLYLGDVRVAQRVWRDPASRFEAQVYATLDNVAGAHDPDFYALPGRLFSVGLNARY